MGYSCTFTNDIFIVWYPIQNGDVGRAALWPRWILKNRQYFWHLSFFEWFRIIYLFAANYMRIPYSVNTHTAAAELNIIHNVRRMGSRVSFLVCYKHQFVYINVNKIAKVRTCLSGKLNRPFGQCGPSSLRHPFVTQSPHLPPGIRLDRIRKRHSRCSVKPAIRSALGKLSNSQIYKISAQQFDFISTAKLDLFSILHFKYTNVGAHENIKKEIQ